MLFGCRDLVQDDKHLRSLEDFDNDKAKKFLLDELQSDYKNPILYFRLGEIYKIQNKLEDAQVNIVHAIELDYENEEYYKTIIPILIQLKKWPEVEKYADILIGLSPSFYHAYYYLVESCVNQNKMDKAGKNIKILSQINAGYPNLPYLKGRFYLAKKDTLDAVYTFEQSIEKGQKINELIFVLSDIYIKQNHKEKAIELLAEHSENKQLDQVKLNMLLAQLADAENNKEKAIHHYRKIFDYGSNCSSAYKLVDHYLMKWKIDSAQYYFDKTMPCLKDRDFYFYKGWLNYRLRNYEEALKSYKIAKELAPVDGTVRWHYKRVYEKLYPPTPIVADSTRKTNENILPIQ